MMNRRGMTTTLSKRGQVLGYAILEGENRMTLRQISAISGVPISTCSDIINKAKQNALTTGNPDLCAAENLTPVPNSVRGSNKALSPEEEQSLIDLALSDASHCRMPLAELGAEGNQYSQSIRIKANQRDIAGLNVCITTIAKTLAADGIHRRKPKKKPLMNDRHKADRLAFCLSHRQTDWRDVIFTDETYFETSNLRERRARGVLHRIGEAYLDRNMDRKFQGGASVMFWGAIVYGYPGSELPYHVYKSPYETQQEKRVASQALQREFEEERRQFDWLEEMGLLEGQPIPELRTRNADRKGGIDWYIYRERILYPCLFPFALMAKEIRPGTIIMEDNAPAHKHHYQAEFRRRVNLQKLEWPANSPDLNPIETIWNEMKDSIKRRLGWNFTARGIRAVVEDEWRRYPVERINIHIMSMNRRIEACIACQGGNNFNY